MKSTNNPVIYKRAAAERLEDIERKEIIKVNVLAKREMRKNKTAKLFFISINLFAALNTVQARKAHLM